MSIRYYYRKSNNSIMQVYHKPNSDNVITVICNKRSVKDKAYLLYEVYLNGIYIKRIKCFNVTDINRLNSYIQTML